MATFTHGSLSSTFQGNSTTSAPGVNNDTTEGYSVGSLWYDTTNDKAYICLDATDGAAVWKEITASGSSSYTAVATLASDQATAADTNPVNLTGLSWSYAANSVYFFRIIGNVSPAASTTGCGFQLNVDTTVTEICMAFWHPSGTSPGYGWSIADDASAGVSISFPGTSTYPTIVMGMLRTDSNAGSAQVRFRSETTAVVTCKAGTTLVVEKVS